MKSWIALPLALFLGVLLAPSASAAVPAQLPAPGSAPGSAPADPVPSYDALVDLYEEFRAYRLPEVTDGVPDYTPDAMARQFEGLRELQSRLAQIDTTGWPVSQQVDYRVVQAEMHGMEFEHRVTQPWVKDPAFYAVINFQFGPKMHRAMSLPSTPVSEGDMADVRERLEAIPVILDQARDNLTDPVADLAYVAIYTTQQQLNRLDSFAEGVREHNPDLVAPAEAARDALHDHREWLIAERPNMRNGAGVGVENYNWWLEHVVLLPYTWEELVALSWREYERTMAAMKLKEHRYRHTPTLEPVESREAYLRRFNEAMAHYHRFLVSSELFTLDPWMEPPEPSTGGWNPDTRTDYFQNVQDRYTLPLSAHGRGHTIDAQHRARDDRPIRGQSRLYFMDGVRQEAFAIGQEKFLYYLGLVDDVPRAHEVMYNLKAFRAARAIADLKMHSNEMTFEEAFQFTVDYTPYGWAPEDSSTLWHDLELYLRSPLYGVGYVVGPMQIERLMTDVFLERGDDFHLTEFMDEFREAGIIPMSLISLEMLGREQERY
ncbi:MAG: DUF885 family protein [Gemmatimonadota bacterium]